MKQANNTRQNRNFSKQITHDKNRQARIVAVQACGTTQIGQQNKVKGEKHTLTSK